MAIKELELSAGLESEPTSEQKKNERRKFKECYRLVAAGDVEKQFELAGHHLNGIGTGVNHKQAFYCYAKSADNGNNEARYIVGTMYEQGIGTEASIKRAVLWYKKALDGYHSEALYRLGLLHIEGSQQLECNLTKGHMYLNLAFLKGQKKAEKVLQTIEPAMTTSQKEEAFALARKFRTKMKTTM